MALTGAQRVAQANAQALSGKVGGAVTSSGKLSSGGSVNAKDLPSYTPGTDPTDRQGTTNQVGPISAMSENISKQLSPTEQAPQELVNQVGQLQQGVTNLAQQKGLTLQKQSDGSYKATPDLSAQYRSAFETANKIVPNAPQTQGGGNAMAQQILGSMAPQAEEASQMTFAEEVDPQISTFLEEYDDFHSPINQRTSLVDEYQKMSKSLGMDQINAELIDAKRIIEGTEDDIRNEITAAGGLATDSQVMAMANARNKSLIKNYNTLLDTRNAISTQLSTLMDLSVQDRQFAEAEFDRKLNFAFKVQEFKERATNNARQGLQWAIQNGAGTEILNDPYQTRLVEKTLGLSSGGLAGMVQQQQLDTQLKQAQINKTLSEANLGNIYGTIDGKPQNQAQSAAQSYGNRLNEANVILTSLGSQFTGTFSMLPNLNFLKSGDRQAYEQAQRNFITAVLRRESGASIAPTEFDTAREQYFPQPGDKPETVIQKEKARNTVINNFYREANVNRPVLPGMIIESNNKKYRVGLDGETLEEI